MIIQLISLLEGALPIVVALICILLSRFRLSENTKYAEKHANDKKALVFRLLKTWGVKYFSILCLIAIVLDCVSTTIALYILTPLLIAINLVFFNAYFSKGIVFIAKGSYYVGLIIISVLQLFYYPDSKTIGEYALGFTLSLAIFESVSALCDGVQYLKKSKSSTK